MSLTLANSELLSVPSLHITGAFGGREQSTLLLRGFLPSDFATDGLKTCSLECRFAVVRGGRGVEMPPGGRRRNIMNSGPLYVLVGVLLECLNCHLPCSYRTHLDDRRWPAILARNLGVAGVEISLRLSCRSNTLLNIDILGEILDFRHSQPGEYQHYRLFYIVCEIRGRSRRWNLSERALEE